MLWGIFLVVFFLVQEVWAIHGGMLYPRESESRQIQELNGMWKFRADYSPNRLRGFDQKWFAKPLDQTGPVIPMPVPSSYNDITTNQSLRDFVGWTWYDRTFFVSPEWQNKRVVLRVDSAHYNSIVWVNSIQVMNHSGGHLPFEAEVNKALNFAGENRITITINNTLSPTTLPPGSIEYKTDKNRYPAGYFVQNLQMDFFNYAGIHRSVRLYSTPRTYIDDITIVTRDTSGVVDYNVTLEGNTAGATLTVDVIDKSGVTVASSSQPRGKIMIPKPHLWWPYTSNGQDPAYFYTFKVAIKDSKNIADFYRLPFGIRSVEWTNTQLLINGKPFYCQGVAKHEDADIRGKGLDYPLIARDFNLLKWLGANCFRTSHYPYAEEIMDQADQQGIVVIDECPGVGIKEVSNMGKVSLNHHLEVMEELVRRDKNRPSVIMWSVANEPGSARPEAGPYFKAVIGHTKYLDPYRPVTFVVGGSDFYEDKAAQYTDIICVNHYYAWYSDMGHLDVIQLQMNYDITNWHKTFNKPVIITEYGADTVAGLHKLPSDAFTEEYQVQFMRKYHEIFDALRKQFLAGEMVWNFADFQTDQATTRVDGNKKGVFTRQRQPKMAAHFLRDRYQGLINRRSGRTCRKSFNLSTYFQEL
ncbi:beta-glucuronidase [Lingula anatina]|uniref:Beta-glucuronidase n=1 Tax=Lingula anatina TaxID=7574 RepID=A0A1S3KA21_LINAN|nr:beta-glucuronidase [Lingula anatina]|eukprot:XP_013419299.1 beta-glucuronidase [Lingula anatina]